MGKVSLLIGSFAVSVTSPNIVSVLPGGSELPSDETSKSQPEKRKREEGEVEKRQDSFLVCVKRRREDGVEEKPKTQFLDLPNDVFYHLYPFLDLPMRRALRVNKRLEKIEKESKFRYGYLAMNFNSITCDGKQISISENEVKEELERLNKTHFNRVFCKGSDKIPIEAIELAININADTIDVSSVTNDHLPHLLNCFKHVLISASAIDDEGVVWIYKAMLDRKGITKYVRVEMDSFDLAWSMDFLDTDENTGQSVPRDNQKFTLFNDGRVLVVRENHLKIVFEGFVIPSKIGYVSFEIVEEEEEEEEDEENLE